MSTPALEQLLADQPVWRGRRTTPAAQSMPTGVSELDALLPTGGWPCGSLSEILLAADGTGELRLVLPALARLTRSGQTVMVIAPPYTPYLPGWAGAGIDMKHVAFVSAAPEQGLWAMEQALSSGGCAAVLGWPRRADHAALRRLQLAAAGSDTLAFVFRARRHAANPSPAGLRLELKTRPARIRVHKCRGGWTPSKLIPFEHHRAA